jgi:type I restriction-modification system DNA methylase subunit
MTAVTLGIPQMHLPLSSGDGLLFNRSILDRYLNDHALTHIPNRARRVEALRNWISNLPNSPSEAQESQLEALFATDVLGAICDYTIWPNPGSSAWIKPPTSVTRLSGTPDVVFGSFAEGSEYEFRAVLELKSPGCNLDAPQPSHPQRATPVEQAFGYGRHLLGVRWVLVSDMKVVRLYSIESDHAYWTFDLSSACDGHDAFDQLWWLLSNLNLNASDVDGFTGAIYELSNSTRVESRDSFYEIYVRIRADIYEAIGASASIAELSITRDEQLSATQRLLDRILFIRYCEDHPSRLIPARTLETLVSTALNLPGASTSRVYAILKEFFREVDAGSPSGSGLHLEAYNGELFKFHPIIDVIDLPDSLATKDYYANERGGVTRRIRGVWGLSRFDFWHELGEHMLGQIFEESLSDLVILGSDEPVDLASMLEQRKQLGVYYTTEILSDYMAEVSILSILRDRALTLAVEADSDPADPHLRMHALRELRVIDFCCGSGAFLVSTYGVLLRELWRLLDLTGDASLNSSAPSMFDVINSTSQASLLRSTVFGIDLLPQAVEIAKLALWLRSARPGEKVSDLSRNIVAGDSLDLESSLSKIELSMGGLDLVIGNPPWGAEMTQASYERACSLVHVNPSEGWDSWELFVLLGLEALRPGGRLCLVLPDSLLYPEKARIRKVLVTSTSIHRVQVLGPGWFGPSVRMGATILEVEKASAGMLAEYQGTLLSGFYRKSAIEGRTPLSQIETQFSKSIPQSRSTAANGFAFEVSRGVQDDRIFSLIFERSVPLSSICDHYRGEEISKSGLYWICQSCFAPTVPGRKRKGGGFQNKRCSNCSAEIDADAVEARHLVRPGQPGEGDEPFLDGDDIVHRYQISAPAKAITTAISDWEFKSRDLYEAEKILIRQAGVGLVATLDDSGARCPQSIYIYRLSDVARSSGFRHEYVLATLLSRTMAYLVFKLFGEVDPDKAHAKMTHTRLSRLPVPAIDFSDRRQSLLHEQISADVRALLAGSESLGGPADIRIELALRELWGLSGDDGTYINRELSLVPDSQVIRDLFPGGFHI